MVHLDTIKQKQLFSNTKIMKNLSLLFVASIIFFSSCKKESITPSTQARIAEPKKEEPVVDGERPMGYYTYTATFIVDIKTGDRRTENCYQVGLNIFFLPGDTIGQFLEDQNIISRDYANEEEIFKIKNNFKLIKTKYTMSGDTVVYKQADTEYKFVFKKDKDGKFVMYNYTPWAMKFMKEQKYTSHTVVVMTKGIVNPKIYPATNCSVPNDNFL